jgi:hypothetical protein
MPSSRNDIRNDINPAPTLACPVCATTFTPVRRQRYCTPACRQAAWRARHPDRTPFSQPALPPRTSNRETTVYQCTTCDARYLGQQWCHDCNRPCTRLGSGGLCPHCDEPNTIDELLG